MLQKGLVLLQEKVARERWCGDALRHRPNRTDTWSMDILGLSEWKFGPPFLALFGIEGGVRMCLSANLYSCRGRLQVSQGLEVFELFEHIPKLIQLLLAGLSCHVLLRFRLRICPSWHQTCGKIGKLRCFQSSLEQTSVALNGPVSPAPS